jgi:hypothetical protein
MARGYTRGRTNARGEFIGHMQGILQTGPGSRRNTPVQNLAHLLEIGAVPEPHSGTFDPATLQLLRSLLDEIWDTLPPGRQAVIPKSDVASHLLRLAQQGQIEPERLKTELICFCEQSAPGAAMPHR